MTAASDNQDCFCVVSYLCAVCHSTLSLFTSLPPFGLTPHNGRVPLHWTALERTDLSLTGGHAGASITVIRPREARKPAGTAALTPRDTATSGRGRPAVLEDLVGPKFVATNCHTWSVVRHFYVRHCLELCLQFVDIDAH